MRATPAAAELVDVFTFIPVVLPPYANDTPPGWSLTGSFEIPAADFSVANTLTLPNSDITALSFTLTYPDGSQVFTLADRKSIWYDNVLCNIDTSGAIDWDWFLGDCG